MENKIQSDFFLPGLLFSQASKQSLRKSIKRVFDLIFSLVLLVLIFPWLFPLIALLIGMDSHGGVLFIQKRTGLNGKVFGCIKFRTMVINDQADTAAACDDDRRITRIGKWLRLYGIDELPQLLNVLYGDMSIVGPRPHMHSDNLKFEKIAVNYRLRYRIRPGITGLAQVMGYKGNFNDSRQIKMRVSLDLIYTDTFSLWLDIKIIIGTIKAMFLKSRHQKGNGRRNDQRLPATAQAQNIGKYH